MDPRRWLKASALVSLTVVILSGVWLMWHIVVGLDTAMRDVLVEVRTMKPPKHKKKIMQTLSTSWTSGGVEHTLTTTRQDGESAPDFIARHNEALDAALGQYPPD